VTALISNIGIINIKEVQVDVNKQLILSQVVTINVFLSGKGQISDFHTTYIWFRHFRHVATNKTRVHPMIQWFSPPALWIQSIF